MFERMAENEVSQVVTLRELDLLELFRHTPLFIYIINVKPIIPRCSFRTKAASANTENVERCCSRCGQNHSNTFMCFMYRL